MVERGATANAGQAQGRRVERLLRIDEVAERLAISRSMTWKLIALRELRSVRIGRAVRVRPDDLEAYLSEAVRER